MDEWGATSYENVKTVGPRSSRRAYEFRRRPMVLRAGSSRSARTAPARRLFMDARRMLAAVPLRPRPSKHVAGAKAQREIWMGQSPSQHDPERWFLLGTEQVPLSSPSEVSSRCICCSLGTCSRDCDPASFAFQQRAISRTSFGCFVITGGRWAIWRQQLSRERVHR